MAWSIKHFQHPLDRKGKDSEVPILTYFYLILSLLEHPNHATVVPSSLPLAETHGNRVCGSTGSPHSEEDGLFISQAKSSLCSPDPERTAPAFAGLKGRMRRYTSTTCVLLHKETSTQRVSYHVSHGRRYVFHTWFTFFFESPWATHLMVNIFRFWTMIIPKLWYFLHFLLDYLFRLTSKKALNVEITFSKPHFV